MGVFSFLACFSDWWGKVSLLPPPCKRLGKRFLSIGQSMCWQYLFIAPFFLPPDFFFEKMPIFFPPPPSGSLTAGFSFSLFFSL